MRVQRNLATFCANVFFFLVWNLWKYTKKKDPKWKMHYLRFHHHCACKERWRTKYCLGLHLGGEFAYKKTGFATDRSTDQHWNILQQAVGGYNSPIPLVNFVLNCLHLPDVPNGVTQFTLVSCNADVHLGKKHKTHSKIKIKTIIHFHFCFCY